jgi:hypothetical protein
MVGPLSLKVQLAHSVEVASESSTGLLALFHMIVDDMVVAILTTVVGIISSYSDLDDTLVNQKHQTIKSSLSRIVHDNLRPANLFAVEICDSGSVNIGRAMRKKAETNLRCFHSQMEKGSCRKSINNDSRSDKIAKE